MIVLVRAESLMEAETMWDLYDKYVLMSTVPVGESTEQGLCTQIGF